MGPSGSGDAAAGKRSASECGSDTETDNDSDCHVSCPQADRHAASVARMDTDVERPTVRPRKRKPQLPQALPETSAPRETAAQALPETVMETAGPQCSDAPLPWERIIMERAAADALAKLRETTGPERASPNPETFCTPTSARGPPADDDLQSLSHEELMRKLHVLHLKCGAITAKVGAADTQDCGYARLRIRKTADTQDCDAFSHLAVCVLARAQLETLSTSPVAARRPIE